MDVYRWRGEADFSTPILLMDLGGEKSTKMK